MSDCRFEILPEITFTDQWVTSDQKIISITKKAVNMELTPSKFNSHLLLNTKKTKQRNVSKPYSLKRDN